MKPEEILDGHDLNQDLHQLVGYVWGHGSLNCKEPFPDQHLGSLVEHILDKHVREKK